MLKKGLGIGVVAVLLMGLAFGTGAGSYVRTSLGWVRQSVRDSVPLEFELGRARQMIKEIDPEVQRNMHLIAKEEVEIKQLQDRLADGEKHLSKSESDMKRLSTDLKRGNQGEAVKDLQQYLIHEGSYLEALVSGYFGRLTENAVKKFQAKYDISPVSGFVGYKTRHRMQQLTGL